MTGTARATFRFVGPIKRSTFQQECPDAVEEAINDILHWSWSARLQMLRLRQSLGAELKTWGARPQVHARRGSSRTSYDEHILLVAVTNLDRALQRAPKIVRFETQVSESVRRALRLLRDIYEHWDTVRAAYRATGGQLRKAALKLRTEFPEADPWSLTFDPTTGAIVIADVVPLAPLLKELRLLEARLLRFERWRKREQASTRARDEQ
jgi:hypothetical protein